MRLIIDIDDEIFKRLKDGCPEPDDCFKCQDSVFYGKPYEETPQGEWKITKAYPHKVYCGECYKTYAQENWEVWKDGSLPRNFCPNCGASMKPKTCTNCETFGQDCGDCEVGDDD